MKTRHLATAALTALSLFTLSGAAQAALVSRGGGMIYDTELNITWLQNWNQAAGSSYDNGSSTTDGRMTWDNAKAWADNLVWGGYSDWRLPTIVDTGAAGCDLSFAGGTDCGFNVQTKSGSSVFSEMAHLWYVTLDNKGYCTPGDAACPMSQPGWGLTNTGSFTGVQSYLHWSGTEYAPYPNGAWGFDTLDGFQYGGVGKNGEWYAVAVRPGDVAAPVPEPQTLALTLLALAAATAARRRTRTAPQARHCGPDGHLNTP